MFFKNFFRSISILSLISLAAVSLGSAQNFDYQQRPVFNYDFIKADINLQLNTSDVSLSGAVQYRLEATISGADTLVLNAANIQVESVFVQNEQVGYSVNDDQLYIALTDSSIMGKQYDLQIDYHTEPRFGLLKNSEGTITTSMLPQTNRHWLPTLDHPRNELITVLTLTVPADYTVAASGVKTDEEILDLNNKKITFRSGKPIPVTALSFSAGNFNKEGASYGIKRIISYAEPNTVSENKQNMLTDKARQIVTEIEEAVEFDYPYQRVHIVVLHDHFWEQKPYGASTVFLYQNRGDLVNQLQRGLYAQWFGVYQHEEQWNKAEAVQFFQTALHYQLADRPALLKKEDIPENNFSTVYGNYSVDRWNNWQHYSEWSTSNMRLIANKIIPELLQKGSGTFTPQQYENIWYRFSGQPSIGFPAFEREKKAPTTEIDSIHYRVEYNLSENAGSLQLVFTALGEPINQPETVPLKIISGGRATDSDITFTGVSDTVSVTVPGGVQSVRFVTNENDRLYLEEHKPVSFLLYQLKNAENVTVRKKAAIQLGYHTNNPDLQLALTNYLNRPMEPEVKASLLRSYANITDGAGGTQQYFLDALSSNDLIVQKAAVKALENYPDNDDVTERIRDFVKNESNNVLSKQALGIYMQRIDSTEVLDFTNSIIQQDTAGTKAIAAIFKLAEMGRTQAAIERASFYIEPVFSYSVRRKALFILLEYDDLSERWDERMELLLTDSDPRIRFLTIQNLSDIPGVNREAVLQQFIPKAYDARVFKAVN